MLLSARAPNPCNPRGLLYLHAMLMNGMHSLRGKPEDHMCSHHVVIEKGIKGDWHHGHRGESVHSSLHDNYTSAPTLSNLRYFGCVTSINFYPSTSFGVDQT